VRHLIPILIAAICLTEAQIRSRECYRDCIKDHSITTYSGGSYKNGLCICEKPIPYEEIKPKGIEGFGTGSSVETGIIQDPKSYGYGY
jgi:hypothetical protein